MSTVKIGDEFENKVFAIFSKLLKEGQLFISYKNTKRFQKKHYYSEQRKGEIIFDIAFESYLPEQETPSFIVFIECKKYKDKVPISDLEEFHSKVMQIAPNANKAILVTNSTFSESGINYAKANGMGLVHIFDDDKIKWLVTREAVDVITYKEVDSAKEEVLKSFIDDNYTMINNRIAFFDYEPIYNSLDFIDSVYNKNKCRKHYFDEFILESIFHKPNSLLNIDYLSDVELISLSRNLRKDLLRNCANSEFKFDTDIIEQYLKENYNFAIKFVEKMHITKPNTYLAYIDYLNKEIIVLNQILEYENRLKFTLIHELSHLYLHRNLLDNLESNRDLIFIPNEMKNRIEIQANKLSSYILLPPDALKEELISIVNQYHLNNRGYYIFLDSQECNRQQCNIIFNRLKNIFGVSRNVIEIRLQEIGFLKIEKREIATFRDLFS